MTEKFEAWGIVELMGHSRAAGRLTEQVIGGANMLRVDVPNGESFRTAFYGASAIYALHVTDEAAARAAATNIGTRPPYAYELRSALQPQLTSPAQPEEEEPEDERDPERDDQEEEAW